MDHQLLLLRVVNGLGRPGAADLGEAREGLVHADIGARPGDQIVRLHEDEAAVVAPPIGLAIAFPLGRPKALLLREEMQIGHREVEGPVRTAGDVRIADTFLFGQIRAAHDRLAVVDVGEGVAIGAEGEVEAVGVVFEIDEEVGGHFALGWEHRGGGRNGAARSQGKKRGERAAWLEKTFKHGACRSSGGRVRVAETGGYRAR
jgi:hypothetical protein